MINNRSTTSETFGLECQANTAEDDILISNAESHREKTRVRQSLN